MSDIKEAKRVGVFVCHCGKNIAGTIDCKTVSDFAKGLPDVVYSCDNLYTCSESGQLELKKAIAEHKLNRVVVAACSPKMHETTFRSCVSETGLNKFLLEMANIREHNSWVHALNPDGATEKAKDQIKMAVAKARLLEPLEPVKVPVTRDAVVIGGGVAGMAAAINIAEAGYDVVLVEKTASLGGKVSFLDKTFPKIDCTYCQLQELINKTLTNPKIRVLTLSEVEEVSGFIGNFNVKILRKPSNINSSCVGCGLCVDACPITLPDKFFKNYKVRKPISLVTTPQTSTGSCNSSSMWDRSTVHLTKLPVVSKVAAIEKELCTNCGRCAEVCPVEAIELNQSPLKEDYKVGAIVLAMGYELFDPNRKTEYGYSKYNDVITSLELERMLNPLGPTKGNFVKLSDNQTPRKVAFIQCVGCRDDTTNTYCGRICCLITLKQVLLLKEKYPGIDVTVFYKDIRSGGKELEVLYNRAQDIGCCFIRGQPTTIEQEQSGLLVRSEDTLIRKSIAKTFDIVILATGIESPFDAKVISEKLKVPLDPNNFFMEAHIKLRPAETVIDGVLLAGSCSGPMDIPTSISRGYAASSKVISLFSKDEIELEPLMSYVNLDICKGCLACMKTCSFQALRPIDVKGKKKIQVLSSLCKGCGTCVASCPFNALDQNQFSDKQIFAQIDAALEEDPSNKILGFNCNWCSYAGADFAGVARMQYPVNIRTIRVMCTGRVSQRMILRAFEKGAGMVLVAPCHPSDCHYISGNAWAKKKIEQLKGILPKKGINPDRLWFVYVSAAEGNVYQRTIKEMTTLLTKMKKGEVSWGENMVSQEVKI